jgi:N-methylhydantoinase B
MSNSIHDLDPITVEVIRKKISSIADQIETNIIRTAYSPLIYEYKDFAVGLVDHEGRLIVQGRGGIPVFSANLHGLAVKDGLDIYGRNDLGHGDVVICNYAGILGQHLNNVAMYTPICPPGGDGTPIAFMAVVVHWADVGGRSIGSFTSNEATDIFQEGIQFRTLKLWCKGMPNREIYRVIEHNTRFPSIVLGDIEAQLAGCLLGRDLFLEMIAEYGLANIEHAIDLAWTQSERSARRFVEQIPDGTYSASAFLDDDGLDIGKPLEMPISVRVSGDNLTVNYSNVSPQVRGPFNSGAFGGGVTAARMAFNFLMDPAEGGNDGIYRPVDVILPSGKFLSAAPTAPMGRYNAPLATVIDVILRALSEAMPDRIAAGHHANIGGHIFTGLDPSTGGLFKNQDTSLGGWGALNDIDGPGPFKTYVHGDTLNVPVELQEATSPLRIDEISLRQDSGGPGRFRGGLGIIKICSVQTPCRLAVSFDRVRCPPWGLAGGEAGQVGGVFVERRTGEVLTILKGEVDLQSGDRVRLEFGGGGGFGPPRERLPELVRRDLALGYISADAAETVYGLSHSDIGKIDRRTGPLGRNSSG